MTDASAIPYDARRHVALARVGEPAISPCGTWAAYAVKRLDAKGAKYVSDLWRVPLDGTGEPSRLTRGTSNDAAPAFRADGSLGFLSDRVDPDGEAPPDEDAKRTQVWLLPREGGEPRPLTDEPLGVEAFAFAERGDRLVVLAPVLPDVEHARQREVAEDRRKNGPSALTYTRMPVRFWDRYLPEAATHVVAYDADGRHRRDLTPQARREHLVEPEFDVSPDGRWVAITSARPGPDRIDDTPLLLLDLETGAGRLLGEIPCASHGAPRFGPDGRALAAVRAVRSRERVATPTLVVFDLASGGERMLAEDWDRWPQLADWTPDGRALIVTADDDGRVPVFRVDARTGAVERLSAASAAGQHAEVRVGPGGQIAGVRSTILEAPEPFVLVPEPGAVPRAPARLCGFERAAFATVEELRVPSTDGTPIHAFLVKPRAPREARLPVLLWIHGGPIGADTDGWHWRWNPLLAVARGYAVCLPNPRGSTGYGQSFVQGIWGNVWGAQCYEDLMAVADALAARPDLDGARMAAMGGSFGGYMTNWIGANTDRFGALVTHASIWSMSAAYGVSDYPAWWLLEMQGDPYDDPAAFDRYSPSRKVRGWRTPTLIVHGERDYRCPVGEGLALFEALQHHGVPSELLVFPDENHWILGPRNIVAWYDAVLGFVDRHLQPPPAGSPSTPAS